MSLSKVKIKYIQSLKDKKTRNKESVFVAEGQKLVSELLATCRCKFIASSNEFMKRYHENCEVIEASENELRKATFLKTAPDVIGIFYKPDNQLDVNLIKNNLSIVLDGIQDPGNLGTIIRIADWFGIKNIFCSEDTADAYSPKVIQATMGAIARVNVFNTVVAELLKELEDLPIYGTFLDGENIYSKQLTNKGIIVMGNEGQGIRPEIEKLVSERLFIPPFPSESETSESLNVAVATAITCSEFRRRV